MHPNPTWILENIVKEAEESDDLENVAVGSILSIKIA